MPHYSVTVVNTVYIVADNEKQAQDRALDLTNGVLQSDDRYVVHMNWEVMGATKLRDPEELKCHRCGHDVDWSTVPGYTYYCPECDEDLYGFEADRKNND